MTVIHQQIGPASNLHEILFFHKCCIHQIQYVTWGVNSSFNIITSLHSSQVWPEQILNNLSAEMVLYKSRDQMVFFQFDIIGNILVSSFFFIWIPIFWVYGHYNLFSSFSVWTDFRRQNLTSKVGPRAEIVKHVKHIYLLVGYCR